MFVSPQHSRKNNFIFRERERERDLLVPRDLVQTKRVGSDYVELLDFLA